MTNNTTQVTVTSINDPPVVTAGQSFSVAENTANGTAVGTVVATDPDVGQTLQNWQITGGNTGGAFAINATTGQITVANSTALDREATPRFTLQRDRFRRHRAPRRPRRSRST